MTMLLKITVLILSALTWTHAYKILVISPMPARSHANLGDGVVRHLLNAGHEVSYITAILPSKPHPNVTIIDVSANKYTAEEETLFDLELQIQGKMGFQETINVFKILMNISSKTVKNPNVQKLIYDPNQKFDLVIAEWMFSELYAGFSALFDCPYIWLSTMEPHWAILRLIDEYTNPSYTADILSTNIPPLTFGQRLQELANQVFGTVLWTFFVNVADTENYDNVFVPALIKRGKPVPSFEELKYNASLVFGNSHVSLGIPSRVPENYKHIGGYHIDENVKPLPEELKKVIESSKYGVIYFSMGSNLKSISLPAELKRGLLKMFGTLKQTVLWKFEEDLPNLPQNVHILRWAPQPSILAHPNVILFITHGGHLSTTESIHFGVPVIGIPVFGDQFVNVGRSVEKGFAKRVDLSFNMVDSLKDAIHEITSDARYRNKVKELSAIYHDRTVSPGRELVHWVDHIIRTKGAPHMRSPALMVPWYQKCYLDLVFTIILFIYVVKYLLSLFISSSRSNKNIKQKTS